MQPSNIILITISIMLLIEGMFFAIFPSFLIKSMKKLIKNKKQIIKLGLIEMIIALLILFLVVV